MVKKGMNNLAKVFIILTVIMFVIIIFSFASCSSKSEPIGNVAVIPIKGIILGDGTGGFGETIASSSTIVALIEKADKALYRAKQTGKNKVCSYDSTM